MLKIWGFAASSNVQKVLWTAAELGLAFERIDIAGTFGGNDQPDYLALNPNGVVPTIDDDGFVLWESNACVRYLAARYGRGSLYAIDLRERAEADRWMDWQQNALLASFRPLFRGLVRQSPKERDNEALARAHRETVGCLAILDAHLEDRDFIGGAALTMGDIPLASWVYRWFNMELERPPMPRLAAWYARLTEREGYRQHIMVPIV